MRTKGDEQSKRKISRVLLPKERRGQELVGCCICELESGTDPPIATSHDDHTAYLPIWLSQQGEIAAKSVFDGDQKGNNCAVLPNTKSKDGRS